MLTCTFASHCIHAWRWACVLTHASTHTWAICTHIYMQLRIPTFIHELTCARIDRHMNIHTYIFAMHMHVQTCRGTCRLVYGPCMPYHTDRQPYMHALIRAVNARIHACTRECGRTYAFSYRRYVCIACVYMPASPHADLHICVCTYIHEYVYTGMYACMHACIHTCNNACMHAARY